MKLLAKKVRNLFCDEIKSRTKDLSCRKTVGIPFHAVVFSSLKQLPSSLSIEKIMEEKQRDLKISENLPI